MKRNEKVVLFLIVIVIIIAGWIMLAAQQNKKVEISPLKKAEENNEEKKPSGMKYVTETIYEGNLEDYPELYNYPFKKTDNYVSNKQLYMENPRIIKLANKAAVGFFDTLLNNDYRDIVEDKNEYMNTLNPYYDGNAIVNVKEEGRTVQYFQDDYMNKMVDYMGTNRVSIMSRFITDESLVYSDLFTFVRGMLEFTVYSCDDQFFPYETGKKYELPIDVALKRADDDLDQYVVIGWGEFGDYNYYIQDILDKGVIEDYEGD